MLNQDKFKTAEERVKAFNDWRTAIKCEGGSYLCDKCKAGPFVNGCEFKWLALEAEEEKPEPCPFCGTSCTAHKGIDMVRPHVSCDNDWCGYKSTEEPTVAEAISAHNRVARAVRAAKESEVK